MLYLGVDPGTSNNMAIAAILPDGRVKVRLARLGKDGDVRSRSTGAALIVRAALQSLVEQDGYTGKPTLAIEWQRVRKMEANPQSIIDLSAFVGIAQATIELFFGSCSVYTPWPNEWKGSIDKHVKQNRIVAMAGLSAIQRALAEAEVPVPANLGRFEKETSALAGDCIDAIGLAQWVKIRSLGLLRSVVTG